MISKDQLEYTVGESRYLITALGATDGIEVMNRIGEFAKNNTSPSSAFVKQVVLKSVTYNNKAVDEKWFDTHFSRNYKELNELFEKIVAFNFGEEEDGFPNEQNDTSD